MRTREAWAHKSVSIVAEVYVATETPGTDYASINLVTHGAPPFARQVIITAVSGAADLQQFTLPADAPIVLVQIIHRDE